MGISAGYAITSSAFLLDLSNVQCVIESQSENVVQFKIPQTFLTMQMAKKCTFSSLLNNASCESLNCKRLLMNIISNEPLVLRLCSEMAVTGKASSHFNKRDIRHFGKDGRNSWNLFVMVRLFKSQGGQCIQIKYQRLSFLMPESIFPKCQIIPKAFQKSQGKRR